LPARKKQPTGHYGVYRTRPKGADHPFLYA